MKIWIVNPYGNLPNEGWREYRSTLIANAFIKQGHEVAWWVSNFEHRSKKFRSEGWKEFLVKDGFLIKMVPTTPYTDHISLARIKSERNFAINFRKKVFETNDRPDLVIVGEPALWHSDIILDVIKKLKVPFIADILDLWPELFNILLPNNLAPLGKFLFAPLYWRRSWFLRKADGIIGATKDYLKIGVAKNLGKFNDVVYLGIDLKDLSKERINSFENKNLENFKKIPDETWVVYAGTLGDNYDISTIIECAQKIENDGLPIKIFLAGEGSLRPLIEDAIKNEKLQSLIYLGRLNANDLTSFYNKCDMALSSYVENSSVSMPVKAFDYLAAGLPLINSLGRDLGGFIKDSQVGIQYNAEDAEDMLRAMKFLSDNKVVCNQMKINALDLAKEFDCEQQYAKVVRMAENIIDKK
ncbi:glycosyltransferase WbuB [Ancylomarina euxinus]|uniref:Glycosyltransferase WbuB n=1 Tax=Ancylomarina euxinus TaxID=2283627 RepID=A0A425XWP6_9BACT|nr:glycosyltransferase family 4 protein [Ancylomarina euxinus]MCZ4696342.1 glycosyltransferase family 4 protein [Ancylomarina euxinus]MUP16757.1 glycosyltransferase [Ancylomarina euxinus]RRG19077.1 glycosyltransferase WbuB [Ancylomarina euxinus]